MEAQVERRWRWTAVNFYNISFIKTGCVAAQVRTYLKVEPHVPLVDPWIHAHTSSGSTLGSPLFTSPWNTSFRGSSFRHLAVSGEGET